MCVYTFPVLSRTIKSWDECSIGIDKKPLFISLAIRSVVPKQAVGFHAWWVSLGRERVIYWIKTARISHATNQEVRFPSITFRSG